MKPASHPVEEATARSVSMLRGDGSGACGNGSPGLV